MVVFLAELSLLTRSNAREEPTQDPAVPKPNRLRDSDTVELETIGAVVSIAAPELPGRHTEGVLGSPATDSQIRLYHAYIMYVQYGRSNAIKGVESRVIRPYMVMIGVAGGLERVRMRGDATPPRPLTLNNTRSWAGVESRVIRPYMVIIDISDSIALTLNNTRDVISSLNVIFHPVEPKQG